ncbi:Hypothetical protein IALB_0854 [Ignavibacterium album JCM 16511]|uniref:DUF1858 domain-containing protein n=1 Tax=Ignavibacterium album (strain DSM 19864 / JCM 16511 / NBRC 101810 / Mat9-16) TaxID=945713 RepID=I0AHV9_IGNAJ|nr:DUF1858 domain-containing protein [Ignavibacterium album]AFH48566.1 Hypothetical protein IALB_0854 [Ignavibacterium album JCM 16511]
MITIDMKISEILNKYPQTLEVFVKVSPHFKKLENKILRKTPASGQSLELSIMVLFLLCVFFLFGSGELSVDSKKRHNTI